MTKLKVSLIVIAAVLLLGLGVVYAGIFFNVAADDPHWGITTRLIEITRERSITTRARNVAAPPALDDPQLLAMGAEHYAEMCTGCHLAPGVDDSEMRSGLYPKPPKLVEHGAHRSAGETFWIIKHGIKMTGMPAWGITHDDQSIWGMVALVQKLPELSPAEYEELVAQGRASGHTHDGEEAGHAHGDVAMPQEQKEAEGHSQGQGGHDHEHADSDTDAKSDAEAKKHEHDDGHSH